MKLDDIKNRTDKLVEVGPDLWASASLLGQARTESNSRRAARRNRGSSGNQQVDILGSFCELFLLREISECPGSDDAVHYMRNQIFNPAGGSRVTGCDLQFREEVTDVSIGIDVKSFDCLPYKKLFAINAQKHRSLYSICQFYYCLIVPRYGRQVVVTKLVPYEDVSTWQEGRLGNYGDPSLNLGIGRFAVLYSSIQNPIGVVQNNTYSREEVQDFRETAKDELVALIPEINGYI